MAEPCHILMATVSAALCAGLEARLSGLRVVMQHFDSGHKACHWLLHNRPHALVFDLDLHDGKHYALLALRHAAQHDPPPPLFLLTDRSSIQTAQSWMRRGAAALVPKAPVLHNQWFLTLLARLVRHHVTGQGEPGVDLFPHATPRMLEVLYQLRLGHTNHEIAAALDITEKGVEGHLTQWYHLTGTRSRLELVILSYCFDVFGLSASGTQ